MAVEVDGRCRRAPLLESVDLVERDEQGMVRPLRIIEVGLEETAHLLEIIRSVAGDAALVDSDIDREGHGMLGESPINLVDRQEFTLALRRPGAK